MAETTREIIFGNRDLRKHKRTYESHRDQYLETVVSAYASEHVLKRIPAGNRGRILTMLFMGLDKLALRAIFPTLDLPEVEIALKTLDARRKFRQGKLTDLEVTALTDGISDFPSLTSSRCEMVREWTRSIPIDKLEYRAIMFPLERWRYIADLVHLNPILDFKVPWFLGYCFNEAPPEGSAIDIMSRLDETNYNELYFMMTPFIPYKLIRLKIKSGFVIPQGFKRLILENEEVSVLLYYWKELTDHMETSERIMVRRLEGVVDLRSLTYGKLVDMILSTSKYGVLHHALIPIAEDKMTQYRVSLEQPVAVIGDASSSMQVAINTSSIIASLLCALFGAKLSFFRKHNQIIDNPPRTAIEAVELAGSIRASGTTSPAASLRYYYDRHEVIKTFIIVTDEIENTTDKGEMSWGQYYSHLGVPGFEGMFFAELYRRYVAEIYSAKLIFVSFTNNPLEDGPMIKDLKRVMGPATDELVEVYKFNLENPDLSRLDYILEKLTVEVPAAAAHIPPQPAAAEKASTIAKI